MIISKVGGINIMNVTSEDVLFDYNGVVFPAIDETHYNKGKEFKRVVVFTYQGLTVKRKYDSDYEHFDVIASKECALIDKLGTEYQTFSLDRQRLEEIDKNNIVLESKVYIHEEKTIGESPHSRYQMWIRMEDGNTIFSDYPINFFTDGIRKSKTESFRSLKQNITKYCKDTGVKPDEFTLNEKLTLEYMQKQIWINKKINA
jgi:hypothetical protein